MSALYNDLSFLVFVYLLTLVWFRWLRCAHAIQEHDRAVRKVSIRQIFDRLTHVYAHWKVTTAALGVASVYVTAVYWDIIIGWHDRRYIVSALLVHALWIATWVIISLPLAIASRSWQGLLVDVALGKLKADHTEESAFTFSDLKDLKPISVWYLVGTTIVGVTTILVPIALLFAKK